MKNIGLIACALALSVFRAFTIVKFWAWYFATPFHLPTFGMWESYGISAFMLLFYKAPKKDDEEEHALVRSAAMIALAWLVAGVLNLWK